MPGCFGKCFSVRKEPRKEAEGSTLKFPLNYSEAHICDYIVDRLPSRLQGDGLHLLRAGPGPIVQRWTHELLDEAGVHSFQDREMLLKARDEMVAAVEEHRRRKRQACSGNSATSGKGSFAAAGGGSETLGSGGGSFRKRSATGNDAGADGAGAADGAAAASEEASAAAAMIAAATNAAAANAAAGLDSDGKPFKLTSDWLNASINLYRISEGQAEGMRHMASSGLDPSTRPRVPSGGSQPAPSATEGTGADGGAGGGGGATGGKSSAAGRKSRFGPVADGAAAAAADGDADGGDAAIKGEGNEESSPSTSSLSSSGAGDAGDYVGGAAEDAACRAVAEAAEGAGVDTGPESGGTGTAAAVAAALGGADQAPVELQRISPPASPTPASASASPMATAAAAQLVSTHSEDVSSQRDVITGVAAGHGLAPKGGAGTSNGGVSKSTLEVEAREADGSGSEGNDTRSGVDRLAALSSFAPGAS